jgi:hypothetical protein
VNGSVLFVDPVSEANGFVNNGFMRASNGGILQISGQFGGGVTNNGTINANGAGSEVQLLNGITITGGTFTTGAGGVIRSLASNTVNVDSVNNLGQWILDNNSTTNVTGNLFNSGSINMLAGANNVFLNFNSGTINLTGSGSINLSTTGGGAALIGNGSGRLVNINNTIRGTGGLGNNNQRFINGPAGLVNADVNGSVLFVDPVSEANGFVNNGFMRASNGGILQISGQFGGGVTNTGGTITAQAGSEVQLLGSIVITGGTINSTGTGVVRVNNGAVATVDNLTLAGNVVTGTLSTLFLNPGTITNTGSINVNAGTNLPSSMNVAGAATVTLNGGGVVNMTNGNAGGIAFVAGGGTLVNANNTFRGTGNLANNNIAFINSGTISADVNAGVLFVDPVAGGGTVDFTNSGTMQASNGGILQLAGQFGGVINNHTGRITANTGSVVQLLSGISVTGGTFSSAGTGAVEVAGGNSAFIANTANTGQINVQSNAALNGTGTLLNNGTISVNAAAISTSFNCNSGTLVITGTGQIVLGSSGAGTAFLAQTGNTMDIGASVTVRGRGNIANNNSSIINRGLITASGGGELFVDPAAPVDSFRNLGIMRAEAGSQLHLNGQFGGGINNTGGQLVVDAGGILLTNGSHNLSGGTATLDGVWNATNSSVTSLQNFRGSGTLNITNSGRVNVLTNGTNTGTSRLAALTITTNGRLDLNDNDLVIDYTGPSPYLATRTLISTARQPSANWAGPGLTSSTAAAQVNKITGLGIVEGSDYIPLFGSTFSGQTIDATSVLVKYTYNGDTDLSGEVDFDDYARVDATFLGGGVSNKWFDGDFDHNGSVDFDDYALIDSAFILQGGPLDGRPGDGWTNSISEEDRWAMYHQHAAQFGDDYVNAFWNVIPEPASGTLLVLAALASAGRRRRTA